MPSEAYDPLLKLWSDERFWLSVVVWALLMSNWLLGGFRGGSLRRWILLAVAVQAAPTVGALLLRFFSHQPPGEELPFGLIVLQPLNVGTLIALMASARSAARPADLPPDERPSVSDNLSAALAERQRIAGDLHDGVATRLVMLLASIPVHNHSNAEIARGLQECLLELQMTVDGLGAERMSLGEMLGNLRYRFAPAFRRSGIEFQWEVSDLAPEVQDDCRTHRELCKIAQEALANALRHSGARRVHVRLAPGRGNTLLTLEISDDGHGLPESGEGDATRRARGARACATCARAPKPSAPASASRTGRRAACGWPWPCH